MVRERARGEVEVGRQEEEVEGRDGMCKGHVVTLTACVERESSCLVLVCLARLSVARTNTERRVADSGTLT